MNTPESRPPEEGLQVLHGGAWKVAAADFFTAMMCLFMVMWILSQDDEMLAQTAHYFSNPYSNVVGEDKAKSPTPIDLGGSTTMATDGDKEEYGGEKRDFIEQMAEQFMKLLNIDAADEDSPFSINTTSDGLMLTIFNRSEKPIFDANTPDFTTWGDLVMKNIAWLIDRYELKVRIEAHTMPGFKGTEDYGAWELSADQANAVRKTMVFYALDPKKLSRVTAYAGTRPIPDLPLDSVDQQRIVISLEPQ